MSSALSAVSDSIVISSSSDIGFVIFGAHAVSKIEAAASRTIRATKRKNETLPFESLMPSCRLHIVIPA